MVAYQGWLKSIPVAPDSNPPGGVDYDLWLGPCTQKRALSSIKTVFILTFVGFGIMPAG